MAQRSSYFVAKREDKTSTFAGGLTIQGTMNFGDAATDTLALTGLTTVATDQKIQFRDTGLYVQSSADGQLDVFGDTKIQITAPTVDIESSTAIALDGDTTIDGAHTFTTGTGNVSLNGDVTVAVDKDIGMSGTGTLTTGTGAVALNGDVTVAADKDIGMSGTATFTTGTGAVALNGTTTVATAKTLAVTDADALTVGSVIVPQEMVVTFPLDATSVDGNIFIADDAWVVTSIEEVHSTAGNDGSAVTLMVDKCTGTEAPGSGTDMIQSTLDLKGTANTVQTGTLSATPADYTLADGDRIAIDVSGALTTLAGGIVVIHMKRA